MGENVARDILLAAILEHRCAELLDCLFNGGSATVDRDNNLVLASGDLIKQMMGNAQP